MFIATSCGANKKRTQIEIIQEIVSQRKDFLKNESEMSIALQNSNIGSIHIIKTIEGAKTEAARDTLKMLYGIESNFAKIKINSKKELLFNQIFKTGKYGFLLEQGSEKSRWKPGIVKYLNKNNNLTFKNENYDIYVSKPIFTLDGDLALVFVHYKAHSLVAIMGKEGEKWTELTHFANVIY